MERRREVRLSLAHGTVQPGGQARPCHRADGALEGIPAERSYGSPHRPADASSAGRKILRVHLRPSSLGSLSCRGPEVIAVGSRVGPYEVLSELGAGGIVYLARDRSTER